MFFGERHLALGTSTPDLEIQGGLPEEGTLTWSPKHSSELEHPEEEEEEGLQGDESAWPRTERRMGWWCRWRKLRKLGVGHRRAFAGAGDVGGASEVLAQMGGQSAGLGQSDAHTDCTPAAGPPLPDSARHPSVIFSVYGSPFFSSSAMAALMPFKVPLKILWKTC